MAKDINKSIGKTRKVDFGVLQGEVAHWSTRNFPTGEPWHPLLGVVEELGELCHAYLKREQGIRGTPEEHQNAMEDAVADLVIFLADFCARNNIDFEEVIEKTWNDVMKRDWQKNKVDGVVKSTIDNSEPNTNTGLLLDARANNFDNAS